MNFQSHGAAQINRSGSSNLERERPRSAQRYCASSADFTVHVFVNCRRVSFALNLSGWGNLNPWSNRFCWLWQWRGYECGGAVFSWSLLTQFTFSKDRKMAFFEAFSKDGFFRSGDLGYKNEKEQLYISGRSKERFQLTQQVLQPLRVCSHVLRQLGCRTWLLLVVKMSLPWKWSRSFQGKRSTWFSIFTWSTCKVAA